MVWQKQKQEQEESGIFFAFFLLAHQGATYPLDFFFPRDRSLSALSFSFSLSLSLPSSRTKSAREKFSEITQPSLPPSGGFFRRARVSRREREIKRDRGERMNSPSPDRYLVTGSLCHSLQAHSPRTEREHTKKNKQIRKPKTNDTRVPWRRCGS